MIFSFGQKQIAIPPLLKEFAGFFQKANKKVFLVGGAVRDTLRGKESSDWDAATDALPEEVSAMFNHVIPTGIKHGTVTVLYKGRSIEVTTFRTESGYSDSRRPDAVQFSSSIEVDLSRRDFTMNAIAADLFTGKIVDPFGGYKDIKRKLIRAVGKPPERFNEDGLRPLRALRFAAALDFKLDSALLAAIPGTLDVTAKVSNERIRVEFEKIIMSAKPDTALHLMKETGLLKLLFEELAACIDVEQKGYHKFDVFTHSMLACTYAAQRGFGEAVRLAALFHDLGKPACARRDENGIWTFYNHEKVSAKLTGNLMRRLRFPNTLIDEVTHLVSEHMFFYEERWSSAAVRRFLVRVGYEHLDALFQLREADAFAAAAQPPPADFLLAFRQRIEDVRAKSSAFSLKDLAVNGWDLVSIGVPPGKQVGIILGELLGAVLEDPALNTRPALLEIAAQYRSKLC